jgi:hypothetical protein
LANIALLNDASQAEPGSSGSAEPSWRDILCCWHDAGLPEAFATFTLVTDACHLTCRIADVHLPVADPIAELPEDASRPQIPSFGALACVVCAPFQSPRPAVVLVYACPILIDSPAAVCKQCLELIADEITPTMRVVLLD